MDEKSAPSGIPSVTYVRVLNGVANAAGVTQNDILTEGNTITVTEAGQPSTRHEVSQILEPGLGDQDICEHTIGNQAGAGMGATLNPIAAFVNDSATAVILLVGSKATKKWSFLKHTFLPFLANELFGTIADREADDVVGDLYNAEVSLSSFEVQDEVVTDLLRPASRGLSVSVVNPTVGVCIPGLHREVCRDEMSLRRALLETCENRACHTLPPGASIDTSSTVWEINLVQSEAVVGEDGLVSSESELRTSRSRLLVVDVPSVDALVHKTGEGALLAGPKLVKSLVTFVDVVRKLSSPARAALAPFRSSKLTHYLSELLGGNALVIGMGLVAPGEPLQSRSTLAIMGALNRAMHYPISAKEYTDVLQGLLCKYRSLILQLEDEIDNGAPIGASAAPAIVTEKAINNLQRELAKSVQDRNTALADAARLYEMLDLLKAKYKTLAEQKSSQATELIRGEEEKVTISRALVELKLAYISLQEQSEKEKFELTSNAMTLKNELYDLDAQLLLARTEGTSVKEQVEELEGKLTETTASLTAANATIAELRNSQALAQEQNLELSAELLSLVNAKESLTGQCKDLQNRADADRLKLEALTAELKEGEAVESDLRAAGRDMEERLLSARKAEAECELELRALKLQLEHNQLNYERSAADFLRSKDEAYNRSKRSYEADIVSLERVREELQMNLHRTERKLKDAEREIIRAREDAAVASKERSSVEVELAEVRESYRAVLATQLTDASGDGTDGVISKGKGTISEKTLMQLTDGSTGSRSAVSYVITNASSPEEKAVASLLSTFVTAEESHKAEITRQRKLLRQLLGHYRTVHDKFRSAVAYVEEKLPGTIAAAHDARKSEGAGQGAGAVEEEEEGYGSGAEGHGAGTGGRLRPPPVVNFEEEEASLLEMVRNLELSERNLDAMGRQIRGKKHRGETSSADGDAQGEVLDAEEDDEEEEGDESLNIDDVDFTDESSVRHFVRATERRRQHDAERSSVLVNAYKKHQQRAEETIAAQKSEIATLHSNIRGLVENSEEWKVQAEHHYKERLRKRIAELRDRQAKELQEVETRVRAALQGEVQAEMRAEAAGGDGGGAPATGDTPPKPPKAKVEALYATPPDSARSTGGGSRAGSRAGDKPASRSQSAKQRAAEDEAMSVFMGSEDDQSVTGAGAGAGAVKASARSSRQRSTRGGGSRSGSGSGSGCGRDEDEPTDAVERFKSSEEMMGVLQASEEANIALRSRATALEEELRLYKVHMRETATGYKKTIIELKARLIACQQQLQMQMQAQGQMPLQPQSGKGTVSGGGDGLESAARAESHSPDSSASAAMAAAVMKGNNKPSSRGTGGSAKGRRASGGSVEGEEADAGRLPLI